MYGHTACGVDGFRCDFNRCVPKNWVCDGFIDCQDGSDERNCSYCSYDEFHCGSGVCIRKEDICDGIRDCPDGRDERQCLRLNKWMRKSMGEGRLEAYSAVSNSWKVVCGEEWDASFMSNRACIRLGYRKANQTWIKEESGLVPVSSRAGDSSPGPGTKRFFNKGRLGLNRSCEKAQVSVHLTCSHFECGKTAISYEPSSRIVGGKESLPGSWPWLVGLHGGDDEVFFCGGVLVSEHWVLTAAHCVGNQTDASGWSVHLGLTRRTASPVFVRRRNVSAIIKHDDFNAKHLFGNDIALLLLSEPVNFDEFLRPVCLPPKEPDLSPETRCTVIGWGKSKHDEMSDYLNVIHEVEVPIVHHSVCSKWYSLQEVPIGETTLCAGYPEGEKDACQGDSGGPLLCPSPSTGQWFVAGIVSWGINCAQPNLPGIYARVNIYRDWIRNTSKSFDLPIDMP